jgi:hypothetical protein
MPTMSCAIQVTDSPMTEEGFVALCGERSVWVDVNPIDRDVRGPHLGGLGELSLYGSVSAMRRLAEAILRGVGEAERLPAMGLPDDGLVDGLEPLVPLAA